VCCLENVSVLELQTIRFYLIQKNVELKEMFGRVNGTVRFKKCKQLFEHQHLLLLRDIWW